MTTYRQLGRSGLHLFPLGLGTMQFGWSAGEDAAFEIMDAYYAAGGNFLDTADIYTTWTPGNPGGVSEEIMGRWMKARGNRDDMVVATKVRGAMGGGRQRGPRHRPPARGTVAPLDSEGLRGQPQRLQVDHIDLYQAHWVDNQTPIEETLSALTELVKRGLRALPRLLELTARGG